MTGSSRTRWALGLWGWPRNEADRNAFSFTFLLVGLFLGWAPPSLDAQSVAEASIPSDVQPSSPTAKNESRRQDQLDRVIVRQGITPSTKLSFWKPLNQTAMLGRVVDLNAGGATLQLEELGADGKPRRVRVPSDQLLDIRPAWGESGVAELVDLFQSGKYAEFIQALRDYDRKSIPPWQQVLLLEMVFRAVDKVQGPAFSGQHFIKLAEVAPAVLYAEIPCCWTVEEPSAELVRKSHEWLAASSEVGQLMGASWLLFGADSGKATQALEKLRGSPNTVVAQLATAQLWRLVSPAKTIEKLPEWLAYRDRMLPPVGLGPTKFLADRLARIGEVDLAVGQWLWIATCLPDRHNSFTKELISAESLLRNAGYHLDADRIAQWLHELDGNSE